MRMGEGKREQEYIGERERGGGVRGKVRIREIRREGKSYSYVYILTCTSKA